MLLQQVVRSRDASCAALLNSPRSAFSESITTVFAEIHGKKPDADVNFDADVQKRKEHLVQPISHNLTRKIQSMGFTPIIHSPAASSTGNEEAEENYPNFNLACSTVLTNSMLNCRQV